MQAGKLRHTITIQQVTTIKTATGAPIETWAPYLITRAAKVDQGGREYLRADKVFNNSPEKFRIRYRAGIDTKMRVLYDGKLYDIKNIADADDRRRELVLSCEAIV